MKRREETRGFRTWKSGKKWLTIGAVTLTVLFGPSNLIGAADVISSSFTNSPESSTSGESANAVENSDLQDSSSINTTQQDIPNDQSSKVIDSPQAPAVPKISGLTLDMDVNTPSSDNTVKYTLTPDGGGWPNNASNAKQFSVSATVSIGDTIKITVPKGITVQTYDIPSGASVNKTIVNGAAELTYTFSTSGVKSFSVSYFLSDQGDNNQFAPGDTTLPITIEGGTTTVTGSIVVTNPITSTATVRTHNTAVSNNIYTADGNSVYNFVMGVKTEPDFTAASTGITQANHAKMSGVIHVPSGFVLVGGSLANYQDTNENVPTDGTAIPAIPAGLSQPGGAGSDIIVSNVVGGGYGVDQTSYNEAYMYLYGYFATGTASGTYHFTPDLTLTPQYYDGTIGNIPVSTGSLADITIGAANPGTMTPMFGGVLEGYDKASIDPEHEGFYSKTISNNTGVKGFVTGKTSDTSINSSIATPNLSVNFLDDTVNQTNILKDYKFTLPQKWCGNLTDVSIATAPNGSVTTSGNLNNIGPFTIVLDNGSSYNVSTISSNDATITTALNGGAHIVSIAGQANILAGNNIEVRLLNAVIEDGTYNNGEQVPITLDVHSVTTDKNMSVTGHLKFFESSVSSSSQFSIKNTLDYNISGTYTQGQTFTTGAKWTLLNKETTMDSNPDGKIIIPGSATTGSTADVRLPTIIVSSVDQGLIDLDQSKINQWGWTYKGTKYYPVITDLGLDTVTGEHLTKLDFSKYTVTIPADTNPAAAFFYPEALPWKVSDVAAPATGTTNQWITQLTDNNKDDLHPVYGGKVYEGSKGMKWTITAPSSISNTVGLAGSKTGDSTYYTEATGMAGFDRGLKSENNDDNNSGKVMLSVTNGSKSEYTNAQTLAVLPNTEEGDSFTMELTGPVTNLSGTGAQVVYSTKNYSLPSDNSDTSIDLTTSDWLNEDQITDWSTIRAVAIKADKLESQIVISGYLPVQVLKIENTKIGDTARIQSYSYAKGKASGSDLSSNTPMKAQIYGIPQITAHYEETLDGSTSNGTVLASEEKITGKDTNGSDSVDESYTSTEKSIGGYTYSGLAVGSAPVSGTLSDDTADITYLYMKNSVKAADVTAKYVDTEGNKISDDVVKSGNIGENYSTEQKDISDYTFKEVQGNATGQFTDKAQTVTYVYTRNPVKAADVTAKYIDIEGNKISDDVVKSGNVGDDYSTEQKDIFGYTFKEVQGNVTGQFTDKVQTVTYIYTKNPVKAADVTAKYVDTEGNKISGDVVKSGNVGDDYSTEQKDISGYTFKEVQGNSTGQFTDKAQTVTYVYTKIKNSTSGNTIARTTSSSQSNSKAKYLTLPQTGDEEKVTLFTLVLGSMMLGIAVVLGEKKWKKKK
ncbi:MucBP domain-containing protein [Lactococcus lactis]|uniref:MucBP domain-containing protein n=1 Tax=Lactococcus lactis TaxID=1358 RepID=UPI001D188F00|nr:MucBP domain-containing protein [Lactococcus lactis]MCC4119941.1 MucBP domain-containing protein [Lactococcus lactis]